MEESDPEFDAEYEAELKRIKLQKARDKVRQDVEGMEETDSEFEELLKEAKLEQVREEVRELMDYKRTKRRIEEDDAVFEVLVGFASVLMAISLIVSILLLIFT